jgi:RimJ/RimL family protein N-acetyltransferase
MSGADQPGRPTLALRPLTQADLPVVRPRFEDPDTRSFFGGPDWPARMFEYSRRATGTTFRGARQTEAHHYLALAAGAPVGYIDCGTFDCCTVYEGEGPGGPIITEMLDVPTGSIAFVIDPLRRGRGLGRVIIAKLFDRPELRLVELFEAGVERENIASRRCLEAAGFEPHTVEPDFEGMLYYRAKRRDLAEARAART